MGNLAFKLLAVAFVIGNVTALYVLHFVNRPSPTTRFSFSSFVASTGTSASVGDVVSLSSDSKLRNGAGTTAYLDRHTLSDAGITNYQFVNMAKMGVSSSYYSTNLISYANVTKVTDPKTSQTTTTYESVLTTFTVDSSDKSVMISHDVAAANVLTSPIRGLATLSDTQAVIMTVDVGAVEVMPVGLSNGQPTLMKGKKTQVTTGSYSNAMGRLGSDAVVVAYYEPYVASGSWKQKVKVMSVLSDGSITGSSAGMEFGPPNLDEKLSTTFSKPLQFGTATSGTFAMVYYSTSSHSSTADDEKGICVTMSQVTGTTIGAFSAAVCNSNVRPAYFHDAVMLSENVMLIALFDKAKNNALTLMTVHLTATTATFRSSYVFPEVAGDYVFGTSNFSPDISLALLSGNRVAVGFLNPSMNGKQSVKILKYSTESLSMKDVTPALPVAASDFTLDVGTASVYDPVTQQVFAVSGDSVVAMHMGFRAKAHQYVSLVECYGAPVGVLRDLDGKTKASVAISGKANDVTTKDNKKMSAGLFYYATTAGYVVSPPTSAAGAEYFTPNEDAKMLVTADSKIGVALDGDTLFVSTAL